MTREEFLILAQALREAYQKQDFLSRPGAADVWYGMLQDLPYDLATAAIKTHIATCKFPPTIAEIREAATRQEYPTAPEAWAMVVKAISNGLYNSQKEFDALPPAAQKAIGSPGMIYHLALVDQGALSVEQSHFIRAYNIEIERERERAMIPANVQSLLADVGQKRLAG